MEYILRFEVRLLENLLVSIVFQTVTTYSVWAIVGNYTPPYFIQSSHICHTTSHALKIMATTVHIISIVVTAMGGQPKSHHGVYTAQCDYMCGYVLARAEEQFINFKSLVMNMINPFHNKITT